MRNKTTEVTEGTERGYLESQNMSTKKLLLFRCMCLDAVKKPRDFTRLTQDYGIRSGTLVSFIFYILLRHTFS